MRHRSKLTLLLLTIIVFSFPSICFAESKTAEGQDCEIYLGDMKNKKELEKTRKLVREQSIQIGLMRIINRVNFTKECFSYVSRNYVDKIVVLSHTEEGRKICEKVRITADLEVINAYLYQDICKVGPWWEWDIHNVLEDKNNKINIGLIIETKIPNLDGYTRELLENEEEDQFHRMMTFAVEIEKFKWNVVDRKHLSKILEEQKLSSSGITDSETVKLGKLLNLDIIVLRMIYKGIRTTKVLKVDTGEVLLFKTY